MQLKKLDHSFYLDNPEIQEALDFDKKNNIWERNKTRGYGVVKVTMNNLTFAIPVRSNIKHSASYILLKNLKDRGIKGMGLDYSKAVLIKKSSHISNENFNLKDKNAGKKLITKTDHVTKQFQTYVEKYIKAKKQNDRNVLNSLEYKFTTLINYHNELNI